MESRILYLAVFVSGMSIMGVEMAASRLLAPWFGSALTVWTALIGLIMVALTVGYWWGGRLADRRPQPEVLYQALLSGGLLVAAIPFASHPLLSATLGSGRVGVVAGSFVAVSLLFAVPLAVLGMTSPFAIRLVAQGKDDAGRSAGSIYALSTAGSILGTFLPGFVTIPLLGTKHTILGFGLAVAGVALLGLGSRAGAAATLAAGVGIAGFLSPVKQIPGLVHARESLYNFIQVVGRQVPGEPGRVRHALVLNEGRAVHSIHDPGSPAAPLVGSVWDYMNVPLVLALRPGPMQAAVIGLAAGTVSHQWLTFAGKEHDLRVDGAEIDPEILEVGREYFAIGEDERGGRLKAVAEDGRVFLAGRPEASYDLILTDAYKQPYIPFHLATREYFELVRSRLKDGGIMAINVGAIDVGAEIFRRLLSTVAAVFGEVRYVLVKNHGVPFNNHVVMAGKGPVAWDRMDPEKNPAIDRIVATSGVAGFRTVFTLAVRNTRRFDDFDPERVFTDDHGAVEFYTERMMVDFLAKGGGIPSD